MSKRILNAMYFIGNIMVLWTSRLTSFYNNKNFIPRKKNILDKPWLKNSIVGCINKNKYKRKV